MFRFRSRIQQAQHAAFVTHQQQVQAQNIRNANMTVRTNPDLHRAAEVLKTQSMYVLPSNCIAFTNIFNIYRF